jgi:hypothetical protein
LNEDIRCRVTDTNDIPLPHATMQLAMPVRR